MTRQTGTTSRWQTLCFQPLSPIPSSLPPSLHLSPVFRQTAARSSTNAEITFHLFWSLLHIPEFYTFSAPPQPPPLFSALQQRNSGWGGLHNPEFILNDEGAGEALFLATFTYCTAALACVCIWRVCVCAAVHEVIINCSDGTDQAVVCTCLTWSCMTKIPGSRRSEISSNR